MSNGSSGAVATLWVKLALSSKDFKKGLGDAQSGMQTLGKNMGAIKAQTLGLVAGLTAIGASLKAVHTVAERGVGIQRLENSFMSLTKVAGTSGDEMLQALDKAAQGSVSRNALILNSNRAMMLGITADVDKMSNLMEVAAFRGRAMGLSTEQAFQDIVTGIGRGSALILDNLGIIIDAKTTYAEYAESIGKTSAELSKQEKTQALLTATLEDGNRQIALAGGLVEDNALEYERFNAQLTNVTDNLKVIAGVKLTPAMTGLTSYLENISTESEKTQNAWSGWLGVLMPAVKGVETFGDAIKMVTDYYEGERRALIESDDSRRQSIESWQEATKAAVEHSEALEGNLELAEDLSKVYDTTLSNMFGAASARKSYLDGIKEEQEKRAELREEVTKLKLEMWYLGEAGELDIQTRGKIVSKIDEHNAAIQGTIAAEKELAQEHEQAYDQMVFDIVRAQMAQDILTLGELDYLTTLATSMGLITKADADRARQATSDAAQYLDAYAAQTGTADELYEALKKINDYSPYTAQVVVEYTGVGMLGEMGSILGGMGPMSIANPARTGFAAGYSSGADFVVPPGYPNDSFPMFVESGEHVQVTPAGGSGGRNVTINIYAEVSGEQDWDLVSQEVARRIG